MTDEPAKETEEKIRKKETKVEQAPVLVEEKRKELRGKAEGIREKTRGAFTELLANVGQEVDHARKEGADSPEIRQEEKAVRSELEGDLKRAEGLTTDFLQKLETPTLGKEASERKEEISLPRFPELFERHRRGLSLQEAREITHESRYLGLRPSTKEISGLSEEEKRVIEDVRSIFGLICQNPQLLEDFPIMRWREPGEPKPKGEKTHLEWFNDWLTGITEKVKGFGVTLELDEEQREKIYDKLWERDQDLNLYFEGLPEKFMAQLERGKLGMPPPLSFIERFRDEYFQAVYMVSLAEGVKDLIGTYYPELVIEWPYKVKATGIGEEGAAYEPLGERDHSILLEAKRLEGKPKERLRIKPIDWAHAYKEMTELYPEKEAPLKRLNMDSISVLHEEIHAVYQEETGGLGLKNEDWGEKGEKKRLKGAFLEQTLTEGFATMMELHFLNLLIRDAEIWGLDEKDVDDFERQRRRRLKLLHQERDHYTEGTVKILHKIFKQRGIRGMIEFLRKVDHARCRRIKRGTPEYEAAIKDLSKIPMKEAKEKAI